MQSKCAILGQNGEEKKKKEKKKASVTLQTIPTVFTITLRLSLPYKTILLFFRSFNTFLRAYICQPQLHIGTAQPSSRVYAVWKGQAPQYCYRNPD